MKIQLFNVRLGLATNSSSSHSMIRLNENGKKKARDRDSGFDFQWDNFVLRSYESKLKYLAAMLWYTRRRLWSQHADRIKDVGYAYKYKKSLTTIESENLRVAVEVAKQILKLCDLPETDRNVEELMFGGIDHDSGFQLPYIPANRQRTGPNLAYVANVKQYLKDEGFAILGGNDNDDGHPLKDSKYGKQIEGVGMDEDGKITENLGAFGGW